MEVNPIVFFSALSVKNSETRYLPGYDVKTGKNIRKNH